MKIATVGVIGAGVMGAGIAQTIGRAGVPVVLIDSAEGAADDALRRIGGSIDRAVAREKITESEGQAAFEKISSGTLDDVKSCDLVIEAASEDMNVKRSIFTTLDEITAATTVLATNTSSLSITEVASVTRDPGRVIGMHFFNPVPVMKLVEIIPGLLTTERVTSATREFATKLGKTPVIVMEGPGFLVNRMLVPMINEAVGIYADGYATMEAIDDAMQLGANHPIGPLALADLIGTDVCLAIMDVLHTEFGDSKYRPHPLLRKMVRGGMLGRKSGRGFYEYGKEGTTQ